MTNNTAPFVSITWHQKEPLGCVVYSHCPTNDAQGDNIKFTPDNDANKVADELFDSSISLY